MALSALDTKIETIGEPEFDSPLVGLSSAKFVDENERVLVDVRTHPDRPIPTPPPSFELAGPRRKVFFAPGGVKCGIVTCGGLCPGLNDVIRAIVHELVHRYGVSEIYGFKYGLQGLVPRYGHEPLHLTLDVVKNILDMGGSILGSSRGDQDMDEIIDELERLDIGILFLLGGDGTLRASYKMANVVTARKLPTSIIGIPKTIDNDIHLTQRTFGFDTAVNVATAAIKSAHNEAEGYPGGVGLIKLMGRHSGFIAAATTLAQQDVNFTLIPESDFDLHGEHGLLQALEKRLDNRGHAVIVVAEGAGQKFFPADKQGKDPSGNVQLHDIGLFLKKEITDYFHGKKKPLALKYIDPSYMVRSLPANPSDSVFCSLFGRDAVHAGMAGKTKLLVGYWNDTFIHVPMATSVGQRKQVSLKGKLWLNVLESTGQGPLVKP